MPGNVDNTITTTESINNGEDNKYKPNCNSESTSAAVSSSSNEECMSFPII